MYISGGYMYISGGYISGGYMYISGGYMYISGGYMYIPGVYPVDICIYPSFDDQFYSDFLPKRHPIINKNRTYLVLKSMICALHVNNIYSIYNFLHRSARAITRHSN